MNITQTVFTWSEHNIIIIWKYFQLLLPPLCYITAIAKYNNLKSESSKIYSLWWSRLLRFTYSFTKHMMSSYFFMISHSQREQICWPDWEQLGIKKKTQRQTLRKLGSGESDAPDERCSWPLHLQVHLFIQHVWESGVKCRLSSHGPRRVAVGTQQLWYVVI
jgi:hypothetical protein